MAQRRTVRWAKSDYSVIRDILVLQIYKTHLEEETGENMSGHQAVHVLQDLQCM